MGVPGGGVCDQGGGVDQGGVHPPVNRMTG